MRLAAWTMLSVCCLTVHGQGFAAEAAPAKPKNTADLLSGKWSGKTPKGNFELVFDDKGVFVSGHFFNFPLKSCTLKTVTPFAFEVVYAIEKMGGMTVTVQFKEGQFSADFRTITGKLNTMLDKGDFSMSKGEAAGAETKKDQVKADKKP